MSTTTLLDKLKRMYVDPPSEGTCYLHIAPEDQRLMIDLLTKQAAEPVEQAAGQSSTSGRCSASCRHSLTRLSARSNSSQLRRSTSAPAYGPR